ncbi:MAG TPA: Fur family transcriptional regulator [Solirubrobacteraceae bacterium]|nr:Fur family transcriptional regulator [Solirubrobacteraceae bacterium]
MTDWTHHALATLERRGYRAGSARRTVVELLGRQHCCLSAKEIEEALRAEGREVGLASVYRALEVLDELRLVQRLDAGEGVVRYEPALAGGEHHHHIVCDRCGSVASFEDEELERAIGRLAERLSWTVDSHDVVLRGHCRRCQP